MWCDKSISTFSIPLGATINMDGTAIMQGCATFFLKLIWYRSGINEILIIVITATIASIGTAGIPSAGIRRFTVIFTQLYTQKVSRLARCRQAFRYDENIG